MGTSRRAAAVAAVAGACALAAASPARADARDDEIRELQRIVREQAEAQARTQARLDELERREAARAEGDALVSAVDDLIAGDPGTGNAVPGSYMGPGRVRRPAAALDIGGYFSTDYRNPEADGKYGSFYDSRLVFQAHAQVSRWIRIDTEIEFEHGGISDDRDGEVKVEYAQLVFSEADAFALKAGTLLVPFGRFNAQHDDPLNELVTRPSVSRYVGGTVFATPGIGIEGVVEADENLSLNYDFVLNNGLADDITADDGIRDARTLFEEDDNHGKTVWGRLGAVPTIGFLDALDLGASFAWGNLGDEGRGQHDLAGYGFDLAAKLGPWEFQGEWSHLEIDRDASAPPDSVEGLGGYYAQLAYRIRDDWVRCLPFADDSASIALVARRDVIDLDDRRRGAGGPDDERGWSFGINYRPTTKTVIKLEVRDAESGAEGDEGSERGMIALEFATYF